jgi:hypothetical protein
MMEIKSPHADVISWKQYAKSNNSDEVLRNILEMSFQEGFLDSRSGWGRFHANVT